MYQATFKEYTLKFKVPAGTSRGKLFEKKSWFLICKKDNITGIGECSPIPGLSPDNIYNYGSKIRDVCAYFNKMHEFRDIDLSEFPSVKFGLESVMKDLKNGGHRLLFPSEFTDGEKSIPINGLIWMGDREFMEMQLKEKLSIGFKCIKLKIGNIDFDSEISMIRNLRNRNPEIEIRLDANGAFRPEQALKKLEKLAEFNIHSVEQPIMPGQTEQMAELCEKSPIPVALDEELIGIYNKIQQLSLLQFIKPAYIILKPSLLGGYSACEQWISLAGETRTKWWVTSALESNIGLNAIAQWVFTFKSKMVQGLGTGMLYENNFISPLEIKSAALHYSPDKQWDISSILL